MCLNEDCGEMKLCSVLLLCRKDVLTLNCWLLLEAGSDLVTGSEANPDHTCDRLSLSVAVRVCVCQCNGGD